MDEQPKFDLYGHIYQSVEAGLTERGKLLTQEYAEKLGLTDEERSLFNKYTIHRGVRLQLYNGAIDKMVALLLDSGFGVDQLAVVNGEQFDGNNTVLVKFGGITIANLLVGQPNNRDSYEAFRFPPNKDSKVITGWIDPKDPSTIYERFDRIYDGIFSKSLLQLVSSMIIERLLEIFSPILESPSIEEILTQQSEYQQIAASLIPLDREETRAELRTTASARDFLLYLQSPPGEREKNDRFEDIKNKFRIESSDDLVNNARTYVRVINALYHQNLRDDESPEPVTDLQTHTDLIILASTTPIDLAEVMPELQSMIVPEAVKLARKGLVTFAHTIQGGTFDVLGSPPEVVFGCPAIRSHQNGVPGGIRFFVKLSKELENNLHAQIMEKTSQ